jgi:hypothetical protein
MIRKQASRVLPAAAFVLAAFVALPAANGQEVWQQSRTGASSWTAGSVPKASPVAGSGSFRQSGGWDSSRQYFRSAGQPGGVWVDSAGLPSSGSSIGSSTGSSTGTSTSRNAAGLQALHGVLAPKPFVSTLMPAPLSRTPAAPQLNKTAMSRSAFAKRSALSSRFQRPTTKPGKSFAFKRSDSAAKSSHFLAPSSDSLVLGSPFAPSKGKAPGLVSPFGGASPNGGSAPLGLNQPLH